MPEFTKESEPLYRRIAELRAQIEDDQAQTIERIRRREDDYQDYRNNQWHEFNLRVEPLRREIAAITKIFTDIEGLKTMPPTIVDGAIP